MQMPKLDYTVSFGTLIQIVVILSSIIYFFGGASSTASVNQKINADTAITEHTTILNLTEQLNALSIQVARLGQQVDDLSTTIKFHDDLSSSKQRK